MGTQFIAFALTILAFQPEPPPDLIRKVAEREAASEAARANYLYRQSILVEELEPGGKAQGSYREAREVIFSPSGERTEQMVGKPQANLKRLILTDEDFQDVRNIQPLLLTPELLPRYQIRFRGEETVDKLDCWVLEIQPRQILMGMRLFEGLAWVDKQTLSVIRTNGKAVPPIYSNGKENLFPTFTTLRQPVEGGLFFPALTYANDVLPFKNGPIRMKLTIRYTGYQRFGSNSTITFDPQQK